MYFKAQTYLFSALLFLSVGKTAIAHPITAPLWGPTGIGVIPTTDLVPESTAEIGLGYERVTPTGARVRFAPVITGTYGTQRGEIGFGWLKEHLTFGPASLDTRYWALHAKYRVWGANDGPAVALGAHRLEYRDVAGHVNSLYVVGSYPLWRSGSGRGLRGHAGLMYNRISAGIVENDVRPMVGADLNLWNNLTLGADYMSRQHAAARLSSVIARYQFSSGLGAEVGTGRTGGDRKSFVSLTYHFGHGAHSGRGGTR